MMADDDPDDREFVREAFEKSGFEGEFRYVEDGGALVEYLERVQSLGSRGNCRIPDLILLDLNMPRVDGYEALRQIKSNERLRRIPIVVLSTSDSEADIQQTYDEGVNSFITEPACFDELVGTASRLKKYWLEFVKLPTGTAH
jgi:CheY-like chemotaxis protein